MHTSSACPSQHHVQQHHQQHKQKQPTACNKQAGNMQKPMTCTKQAQNMYKSACMHQPACQTHAKNKHEACRSQVCTRQAQNMHTIAYTRHSRNNQTHAQHKQEACIMPAHFQSKHKKEARERIPLNPRSSHTPQDAGLNELTNAGATVNGERPALVPWQPEVRVTLWAP